MHDTPVGRPSFGGSHPCVFFKASRDGEVLIFDGAFRRYRKSLRHCESLVRPGGQIPAFGPASWRRSVVRIARAGSGLGPLGEGLAFSEGKRTVVLELPTAGIGEPRRHFSVEHSGPNRFRPWSHLLIRKERHGCDFSRPVALLAVVLQDGQHIAIEGGRCRGEGRRENQSQKALHDFMIGESRLA